MSNISVRAFSFTQDEKNTWEAYVKAKDSCLGYALPSWFTIFEQAFEHKTYALVAQDDKQNIVGILPICHVQSKVFGTHLCSLPFVNYGGILSDTPEASTALLHAAQNLRKELKAESIELRHMQPCGLDLPAKADHKVSMILDLPEHADILWKGFKDKVRNQVRKAEKNGLSVTRGGAELLDDFYAVFCVNMRDLGTPVYAKSFFAMVLEHLGKDAELLCVYREGICIASGLLYRYGNTMQMPWASSLLAHRSLCPNHSLYWEAMRISCEEGFAHFDFGRSTPQSGPWSFKKQWGVREVPLYWEYILEEGASLPALTVNNPKYQMAIATWKKIPLWLANTLGPHIVRGIP